MGDASSPRSWYASFLRRHGFPLLLTGFAVFQLIYLAVFTQGFFLTRYEIPTKQTCQPPAGSNIHTDSPQSLSSSSAADLSAASCWFPRQYDRVVILMVDALRFDFVFFNSSIDPAKRESTLPYVNELPAINEVLTSPTDRSHSSLFRFVADPPTVTMQRIKGLTTGGLPTFIDIANNFGGAVITEDNWISQLVSSQRWRSNGGIANATQSNVMNFFGDDTWFDLYPPVKHFSSKSAAYPSFNVKDLHTVDNGCLKHLEPMLVQEMNRLSVEEAQLNGKPVPQSEAAPDQEEDWDVTLAHFLGVDHVGHRYGPNHPEMRLKLTQMNGVFSRNIEYIRHQRKVNELIRSKKAKGQKVDGSAKEQEVLFIVMGDHGMTSEGNHGGQSAEEIYAGLFMYSTRHINQRASSASSKNEGRFFEEVRANNEANMDAFSLAAGLPDNGAFSLPPLSNSFTSFQSIPQVDFVPTISLLLGLPIPFGNIGKIIPELFWGRENDGSSSLEATAASGEESLKRSLVIERIESFQPLLHAIYMNALQISTYFFKYAELVGAKNFDSTFLHENGELKTRAEQAWREIKNILGGEDDRHSWKSKASLEELRALEQKCVRAYIDFHRFLTRSAAFAQAKWTNFTISSMNFGVAILALLAASVAAFILNANKAYLIQLLQLSPSVSSSALKPSLRKNRFSHPMYALLKSILIVFPLILAPMHLLTFLPLTSGSSRDQPQDDLFEIAFNFIKTNEVWIAACGTLLFGLLVSLRNLSQKMAWLREFSAGYPSEATALGLSKWSWPSIQGFVAGVVVVVYIQGQFSNSFIVAEGSVVLYSAAMLAFSWLFGASSSNSSNTATTSSNSSWSSLFWLTLLLLSMRSMSFASSNTAPDANFMDINKYTNQDVLFMIVALVLLQIFSVYTARVLLRPFISQSNFSAVIRSLLKAPVNQQALKRINLFSILHFILIPASITLISLFWSLQSPTYPPSVSESLLSWVFDPLWAVHDNFLLPLQFLFGVNPVDDKRWLVRVAFPRAVYIIAVGGMLALFIYPIRLFSPAAAEPRGNQNCVGSKHDEQNTDTDGDADVQEGHQLRRRKDVLTSSVTPSTPVSSEVSNDALMQFHLSHLRSRLLALSWFSFLSLLSLPLMLVWGPKSSVVILNCWCVGVALVKLLPKDSNNSNRSPTLNFSAYVFILFLSLHLFYATGHTNSFSSLQVSCAFIGFDIFNFYVGGLLLMLNTFGHVILALGIGIIVGCVRRAQSEKQHAEASEKHGSSSPTANTKLSNDFAAPASQANAILHFQQMSLSWLLCLTFCRTLFSTLNVYLHRRHLMVWAIFAPKYMFDAVFNVALDVICVLFAMATARWSQSLDNK